MVMIGGRGHDLAERSDRAEALACGRSQVLAPAAAVSRRFDLKFAFDCVRKQYVSVHCG
jgi:hypothetical protein